MGKNTLKFIWGIFLLLVSVLAIIGWFRGITFYDNIHPVVHILLLICYLITGARGIGYIEEAIEKDE